MLVYIVRHAWAEERDAERWPKDDLRPLTGKGKRRFARFARLLVQRGFAPRLIVTSPLVRCRQTAYLAAEATGKRKVIERPELAPGSDLEGLLKWTAQEAHDVDEIAWVGHAPDVDHLAATLIGDGRAAIQFAKGAVAAVGFEDLPESGKGVLLWLLRAKLLGC